MNVQRNGRNVTVEITADGEGLVSHAGSLLLARIADKTGLTRALSAGLAARGPTSRLDWTSIGPIRPDRLETKP